MGRSIAENIHRSETPGWMYAELIGQMYEILNHKGNKEEVVKKLMAKTGFSRTTVQMYIDISTLPSEIIELMKSPKERSELVSELLKSMPVTGIEKILDVNKAQKIAQELKGFSKEKMLEVAAFVLNLRKEDAFTLIEKVKTYPKEPLIKLHELISAIPKGGRYIFEFGSNVVRGLDTACIKRQMDVKSLISYYVEEGLRRDGYL
jgi:hypothetical protein